MHDRRAPVVNKEQYCSTADRDMAYGNKSTLVSFQLLRLDTIAGRSLSARQQYSAVQVLFETAQIDHWKNTFGIYGHIGVQSAPHAIEISC